MNKGRAVPVGQISGGVVPAVVEVIAEVVAGALTSPTLVVLPGKVWRQELESELLRLGIPGDQAPRAAAHALHRICGHAGFRTNYLVDAEDDHP